MPRKDPAAKLEYQREWYARPGNRERTIRAVAKRKHTLYAGRCRNCGGPTVGSTKGAASEWCAKPECASKQRKLLAGERSSKAKPRPAKSTPKASTPEVSRYFKPRKEVKKK